MFYKATGQQIWFGLVWFGLGCLEVGFNVDEAGLEYLIFLPLPAKCISKAGYTMLGTEPGVCAH